MQLLHALDSMKMFFAKGAAALLALLLGVLPLDATIKNQIPATLAYGPWFWATARLRPVNEDVRSALERAGGFIKGVCHAPAEQALPDANAQWTRQGIWVFPFDSGGNVRPEWEWQKQVFAQYKALGIKVLAITPSPRYWIEYGVDPRAPGNEERVREIAAFLMTELQGLADGIQVCNEIGIPMFTAPLTTAEACRLMGLQLEGFARAGKGDIIVGYNTAVTQMDVHAAMRPYLQYVDWVGTDIHLGSHMAFGSWMFLYDVIIDMLWGFTEKPIIVTEFGYLSDGKSKTPEEKKAILQSYGYASEAAARADIEGFTAKLPAAMQDKINRLGGSSKGDYIFKTDCANHLWKEIPGGAMLRGYEHTLEGQAKFFADMIPKLAKKPYVVGLFPYNWKDEGACSWCGQPDCPIEATGWGLLNADGSAKPALAAVKQAFGSLKR